jgi:hypothetical protein
MQSIAEYTDIVQRVLGGVCNRGKREMLFFYYALFYCYIKPLANYYLIVYNKTAGG